MEAKRQVGAGTIALGVVTGGLWFLAIPFYRKRCCICRSTAVSATMPDPENASRAVSPADYSQAMQARLADLERRLSLTETELEAAVTRLERLGTEQDFYRQLLEDPDARRRLGKG
ncbi:MAG: hypothetical protein PVH00_09425 [Gemmatimonadota bacterium]